MSKFSLSIVTGLLSMNLLMSSTSHAFETPSDLSQKPYELLKCNSKHGTIWASFGRVTSSDLGGSRYFFTELVFFSDAGVYRKVFPSWDVSLKEAPINVRSNGLSFEFKTDINGVQQDQLVQLVAFYPSFPSALQGNWTLSETAKDDAMGLVGCTLL